MKIKINFKPLIIKLTNILGRKMLALENQNLLSMLVFFLLVNILFAQSFSIEKIEPPNWWTDLKPDTVQLLVYGKNLHGVKVISKNKNFKIISSKDGYSSNYLFLYFKLNVQKAGQYPLIFKKKGEVSINYSVKKKSENNNIHRGFDGSDVVYLTFTDRFCDGDYANDTIKNKYEKFKPLTLNGRHGGDLQGVINKLNYLKDLGVTALWITPVLENNMWMSYHGYAATDLYKVDKRFGSNELYRRLVDRAHELGLKVIMDHVSNHVGINHPWVKYLPWKSWFNGSKRNVPPVSNNKIAYFDVHADSLTPVKTETGWFTDYMPDLNKRNKLLADYMIENTIWWIEYLGIDGIREDTYPYNNLRYMSRWAKTIERNYPNFTIVSEIWKGLPLILSEYQAYPKINLGFNSYVPSVTDYALYDAFVKFLKNRGGLNAIYETLAQDFVYRRPDMLLTFIDNHDVDRAMSVAKGDVNRFKMALGMLLTTRGIPEIFYGDEIGITGMGQDGLRRAHFPGGFKNDGRNAFLASGRTKRENEIFNFTQWLLRLRKKFKALKFGKLIQFPPSENIYVYFRIYKSQKIMILLNNGKNKRTVALNEQKYLINGADLINLYTLKKTSCSSEMKIKAAPESIQIFLVKEK